MKRSFASVEVIGNVPDRKKPILWIANHVSWWDGIWVLWVNEKHYQRKFHFMMLEEQLLENWFFQYTGGFSVKKGTRSMIKSLNYSVELLGNSRNMVLLFPQGEIQSMHQTTFNFQKGVERILQQTDTEIQVIMQASFVDYFSTPKPALFLYLQEYQGTATQGELKEAYNRFYSKCLHEQSKKTS